MSGFKRFFFVTAATLVIILTLLTAAVFSFKDKTLDAVAVNDLVETIKENRDDLSVLKNKDSEFEYCILNSENQSEFSTKGGDFSDIKNPTDAASKGFICVPVTQNGSFLGTLIIKNPVKNEYAKMRRNIVILAALSAVALIAFGESFLCYVNKNVTIPFMKMKQFATTIARGDLDEPLLIEKNNLFGAFTESFDIMREELKAAKNRETALKMREKELVASLSHDLKTPVTGIKVICELLQVKVEDEYVKGKIANIEQKTKEIDTLVSDLLSSALDDLGQMNVSLSDVPSSVINEIVTEHDLRKKVSLCPIPECMVKIDRNRFSQVIGNIITNSYKYADTDIDLSYSFEGSFLKMTVADHGPGVDPSEIELITNKFYRGTKNTAGKEGSGLGLYISSELMKKMGGRLICDTSPDGFEVSLLIALS